MRRPSLLRFALLLPAALAAASLLTACGEEGPGKKEISHPEATAKAVLAASDLGTAAHRDAVMQSRFCASCHPAIYAEHEENTHGRAFIDREARIATRDMLREDCVRCHTPRPIFETGIGMTPIARHHDLDEGNTCMTCHFKPGYDYSHFVGGKECTRAFDPRTNSVATCVTCHRVAGTPEQWSLAVNGKLKGRTCMNCHMPIVMRPIAVGEKPTRVHSHLFPAADNEHQLRRAYTYRARIVKNEVVVSISNTGAGHNFNTANAQRAVESLVVVRDPKGRELYRSRMIFAHGVANPGLIEGKVLRMPSNTQIPSGATREQRVPLKVANGIVECRFYFKRYHPAPDSQPGTSVLLEDVKLVFNDVTPSPKPVERHAKAPPAGNPPPAATPAEAADPHGLVKFAYPKPGTKAVRIPKGTDPAEIEQLIALFEYPVPYAKKAAVRRLVEIGAPAVPYLVKAMGYWDNETFNRAMLALREIGTPAVPAVTKALESPELYIRKHAREVISDLGFPGDRDVIRAKLVAGLSMRNPVDRMSSAVALGRFGDPTVAGRLTKLLGDPDWDTVTAAATSLAKLGAKTAIPGIRSALKRAPFIETRCDLATALAALGSPAGIPVLIEGLRHPDPVIRQSCFIAIFDYTGLYGGYDPRGTEFERRRGIRKIVDAFVKKGGATLLRRPRTPDPKTARRAWNLVERLGGGTDTIPGGNDTAIRKKLVGMGDFALPALVRGLLGFPPGFAKKRALICQILGDLGNHNAAPYLAWTLDDPVLSVETWACWALERAGRKDAVPALKDYEARLRDRAANGSIPKAWGSPDALLAEAARARLANGDETARDELIGFLLSNDLSARRVAIEGLAARYGFRYGFKADAPLVERRAAYAKWQEKQLGH